MALLGNRMDSKRFSRLAFLPITDKSGPTLPPTPWIVWHLRHCKLLLRLTASNSLPRSALPLRLARADGLGSFLGSSFAGGGKAANALSRTSLYGLLRKVRPISVLTKSGRALLRFASRSHKPP